MKIAKVGVVGSGQIGPDIALFFSKALGAPVAVVDVDAAALSAGAARTRKKLDKGVESGAFKKPEAAAIFTRLTFTQDYEALRGADFVVEAATERLPVKRAIVARLEGLCGENAVLASNSSHMEPEEIFAETRHPRRTLVIHYFFPAERNRLVEIVPGAKTDPAVAAECLKLYESMGKVPIEVKSRYGYAVDPIFEGLFQAAAACVEDRLASPKQVDAIAVKALGLGVGPFTAMNLTGGNPITQHGLNEMHDKVMPWFRSPRLLDEQIASGRPWEAAARGETVEVPPATFEAVADRLWGAFLGLAGEIVDSGIVSPADLEMAVEIGLVMKPPLSAMNRLGRDRVRALIGGVAGLPAPRCLERMPFEIPCVLRRDAGDVAIVTIRRPQALNALNEEVQAQLRRHFEAIRDDRRIRGAVLTGYGTKAFVSGADIGMLAAIRTPAQGEAASRGTQEVFGLIENLGKPVVCALNGLALGGGSELALACAARIAKAGLRVLAGQPETNLGIIPGAGGTQRLPRLIPFDRAWEMLRTGRTISSEEAREIGYVQRLTEGDVVEAAAAWIREGVEAAPIRRGPLAEVPAVKEVDIGHRSRKIDELLRRAILEGARMPLEEGLALETRLFGECCATRDMKIGMENFIQSGPRRPAAFVHG